MFNEIAKSVVFNTEIVRKYFNSDSRMFAWLNKMQRDNRIIKIKRDLYCVTDPTTGNVYADKYMIASGISESSYVAYHSALEYHGIANQVYNSVYVAGNERFSDFEFGDLGYHYTRSPLNEGITHIFKGVDLKVTDLERTILDCLNNLKLAGGMEEFMNAMDAVVFVNEEKLSRYLEAYGKNMLYRKAGYIFSNYQEQLRLSDDFFKLCKSKVNENVFYFLKDESDNLKLDSKWNLVAPSFEDLRKTINGGY